MAKGWRVRPLRKPDATSCLALAGNIQPRPEVETSHPDTVVGEFAYEPILSGPRSVAVINALERTQLQLNVRAAREELVAMKKGRVRGCAPAAQEGSEARGRAEGPLREGLHLGAPVDPEHLPRRYQAGAAAPGASAHEIAASQVWPGDPDGPARAKLVTVAGGYGSKPHEIARNTGLTVEEARAVLSAISPGIEIFRAYTRKIAWAVPQYEGFIFTDPFCSTRVLGRARTGSRLKSYKRRPSGSWRRRVSRLVSSWLRQRP
jgi:hypothetical protein